MTTTIIPDARSTFLPLQPAATLTPSVDWGLDSLNMQNDNPEGRYDRPGCRILP